MKINSVYKKAAKVATACVIASMMTSMMTSTSLAAGAASANDIGAKPKDGTYMGDGDGAVTVVRIQGTKVTLGSLGADMEPSAKLINSALSADNGFTGKLVMLPGGKMTITLGNKAQSEPKCQISGVIKPQGSFRLLKGDEPGCAYYHGASWGFVPVDQDSPSGDLKPILTN